MVEEGKIRKCSHAGCSCPADPESDYCSTQCQTSGEAAGKACSCTHEICQQGQKLSRGGAPDGSYDPATNERDKEKPLMDDWGKSDKH
jgi:hypothetical protein